MVPAPLISPVSLFGSQQTKSEWSTSSTSSVLPWPKPSSRKSCTLALFSSDIDRGLLSPLLLSVVEPYPLAGEAKTKWVEGWAARKGTSENTLTGSPTSENRTSEHLGE